MSLVMKKLTSGNQERQKLPLHSNQDLGVVSWEIMSRDKLFYPDPCALGLSQNILKSSNSGVNKLTILDHFPLKMSAHI